MKPCIECGGEFTIDDRQKYVGADAERFGPLCSKCYLAESKKAKDEG